MLQRSINNNENNNNSVFDSKKNEAMALLSALLCILWAMAARRGLVGAAAKIQIKGVRGLKCKFQIIVQTFKTGPRSKHHGRDDVFWRPRPKGGDDVFLFSLLETAAKQRQLNRLSAGRTTVHADFVVTLL
jgi:hypothetical protein